EAHQRLKRRAAVVAHAEAVAVEHHVRAGVDARGPWTLAETAQVRSVLHGEFRRRRLADVELSAARASVERAVAGAQERRQRVLGGGYKDLEGLTAVRRDPGGVREGGGDAEVDLPF